MFCWFVNINNQYITKRHKARWANIYKSEELEESSTCAKNAQVRIEGKRMIQRDILFYNLDMIISVGYRVGTGRRVGSRKICDTQEIWQERWIYSNAKC